MHSRCCCPPESDRPDFLRKSSLTSSQIAARWSDDLDDLVELRLVLHAVAARAVGDVVVDRHRERVGPLEDEADPLADLDRLGVGRRNVLVVEEDRSLDPGSRDEVVHPVEAAQDRALAAAGRPDERGDGVRRDVEVDVADGPLVAVVDVDVAHLELGRGAHHDGRSGGGGGRGRDGLGARLPRPLGGPCRATAVGDETIVMASSGSAVVMSGIRHRSAGAGAGGRDPGRRG